MKGRATGIAWPFFVSERPFEHMSKSKFCVIMNMSLFRDMKYCYFGLCLFVCQCLQGQAPELFHEIDKIIRYDTELVYPLERSFVVGIVHQDTSYILNFGPEHIDTFDLFEIGGLTKVFTATLATKLHLSDLLNLEAPINSFLPKQYQNPILKTSTLEDLLMHQIKFPKRPADLSSKEYDISNPYAYYTKEDVLNYYAHFKPSSSTSWLRPSVDYSHINYALLEIIMESEMKMPIEDLLQMYVFQDLEMMHTSMNYPHEAIAVGYDRSNMMPDAWRFQSFAGSEGLVSCMADLLRFMKLSIAGEHQMLYESQLLKEQSKITNKLAHSYAWYVMNSRKTGQIFTHSGSTERHKAYMHFKKDSRTGVVILCQTSKGIEDLGLLILRLINDNY